MVRRSRLSLLVAAVLLWLASDDLPAQSIFTIAGGASSDGRPATLAGINNPRAVVMDHEGNLYIAEYFADRVRRVTPDGLITTFAGDGSSGFRGDGGPAVEGTVDSPEALALDAEGNLYIAGTIGSRIYKVDRATGILHWIGGNGLPIFSGDGGPAKNAGMYEPTGIAVDGNGNVFVAVARDHRIRRIDGRTSIITTIAGNGTGSFSGDGGPASAATLKNPEHLAIDFAGNLYVADTQNHRVRKIDAATGTITTIAGNGSEGYSGDGGPAKMAALAWPEGLAVDDVGNVFVTSGTGFSGASLGSDRVRRIDAATGTIRTVAGTGSRGYSGDGGMATQARIWCDEVEVDASGNLYLADGLNNRVRMIQRGLNTITTIAGNGNTSTTGDGGPALAAEFALPHGIVVDRSGNLLIADGQANRIRKVDMKTGVISTIAGTGTSGSAGDGGPAVSAQISGPRDVTLDANGNVYFVEFTKAVRRIDALTGRISTVFSVSPFVDYIDALAVDGSGNVYVSDYNNHVVLKKPPSGAAAVYAGNRVGAGNQYQGSFSGDGGPAAQAGLSRPRGVSVDASGNLFIADSYNNRVRRVDAATGIITTVAGSGPTGAGGRNEGDGGLATNARFHSPNDVTIDGEGSMLITELAHVRKVDGKTKVITTVAGNGDFNFTGDGGRATAAGLRNPESVALDAAGNFFLSDSSNRVRGVFACVSVGAPSLASPSDGSTGVSQSPRLAWNAVSGAFRYDVLLDTVSPPKQIVGSDIATTTFAPSNLSPLTTYYWQVVAKGDPFCVPFSTGTSAVRSFTTTGSCTAPGAFGIAPP